MLKHFSNVLIHVSKYVKICFLLIDVKKRLAMLTHDSNMLTVC